MKIPHIADFARCKRCNRFMDADDLRMTRFGPLCEDCLEVISPPFESDLDETLVLETEDD